MLPKPKRYTLQDITFYRDQLVMQLTLYLTSDTEVAEFVNTLAPVTLVEPSVIGRYRVELSPLYCYDKQSLAATVAWLYEQLEMEFGNTSKPAKAQGD